MGFSLSKNIDKFRLEFGDPGNFLKAWYLNFKIEILADTKSFYSTTTKMIAFKFK